jgi:rod shape-determining protein MreC
LVGVAMSRRSGSRSRLRFTLLLLVLTSITLLTLDFRGFGPLESAHNGAQAVFAPVSDAATSVFRPVGNWWTGMFHSSDLEEQNKKLQQQVDELTGQVAANADAQKQLDQLRQQLNINFVGQNQTVRARVTSGAIGNFENTIEIDKGASSGIKKDMPVVSGAGLIGKVASVTDGRAVISLITNRDFKVGVKVTAKPGLGLASGTGEEHKISASFGNKDPVDVNDILVTSGTDSDQRSAYPADIPVGKVTAARVDDTALTKDLDVDLLANLTDLEFVTVVLYTPQPDNS